MNFTALTATVQPNLDVNYIGMDVHSDNVVVCVRRNTINSSGQLVGKTIKTKKVVIKSSQEPLVELLSKYADGQQHIMTAESTFNWYWRRYCRRPWLEFPLSGSLHRQPSQHQGCQRRNRCRVPGRPTAHGVSQEHQCPSSQATWRAGSDAAPSAGHARGLRQKGTPQQPLP